jgi:hypothetical protein
VSSPRRISTNAVSQLVAQAGVLALNLVASPVIVHGLGLEAYGLLVLVGITTNYFGFVELGLGQRPSSSWPPTSRAAGLPSCAPSSGRRRLLTSP